MKKIVYNLLRILPDKQYIKLQYWYLTKRKLNLKDPKRYNEKLQWLKLYDRKDEYTLYVDKYRVKDYIDKKIGKSHVIKTLKKWDNVEDINIDELPQKFVLKCNHDSKSVFICKNKSEFDLEKVKEKLKKSLKHNQFYYGREWPYKNVKPLIFAEEYIEDESGGLRDYKVLCFDGVPKYVQVHSGRFTDNYTHDIYDINWNLMEFNQKGEVSSSKKYKKPIFLKEMLELSAILSRGIPHIRVDWYFADGNLYFGELTFFDAAGYLDFTPESYNYILGEMIKLPGKE